MGSSDFAGGSFTVKGTPAPTQSGPTGFAVNGPLTVGAQTVSDSSGNLASANGITYSGPVTNITIVKGIVTAVS